MTMAPDLLTVNGFTFCAQHGDEYCYLCTYDFRNMNNYVILDELDEEFTELLSDVSNILSSKSNVHSKFKERSFMFNIYHLGVQ